MKKMNFFVFLSLSVLLLTNCNKEEKNLEENKVEKTEVATVENKDEKADKPIENEEDIKISDEAYKRLGEFVKNKEEVIEKLKTLNQEEADKLYDEYYIKNRELYNKIISEVSPKTEEEFEKMSKFFNKYDLVLLDAPGSPILTEFPDFYYNIFKDYVSDEYRDYLENRFKYNDDDHYLVPYNLSLEEIGERIATWEAYFTEYPNSKLRNFAVDSYAHYMETYLGAQIEDKKTVKEYYRFIKKYPNSATTKIIEYYLGNYKNRNVYTEINEMINKLFN